MFFTLKMEDIQTELKSEFMNKKIIRVAQNQKMFKTITSEKIETISVWKCFSKESGDLLSYGAVLYRKATQEESPRKLISVLKMKKKDTDLIIDDEIVSKPKMEVFLEWCLKQV